MRFMVFVHPLQNDEIRKIKVFTVGELVNKSRRKGCRTVFKSVY